MLADAETLFVRGLAEGRAVSVSSLSAESFVRHITAGEMCRALRLGRVRMCADSCPLEIAARCAPDIALEILGVCDAAGVRVVDAPQRGAGVLAAAMCWPRLESFFPQPAPPHARRVGELVDRLFAAGCDASAAAGRPLSGMLRTTVVGRCLFWGTLLAGAVQNPGAGLERLHRVLRDGVPLELVTIDGRRVAADCVPLEPDVLAAIRAERSRRVRWGVLRQAWIEVVVRRCRAAATSPT